MQTRVKKKAAIGKLNAKRQEFNRMVAEMNGEDIEGELFDKSVSKVAVIFACDCVN